MAQNFRDLSGFQSQMISQASCFLMKIFVLMGWGPLSWVLVLWARIPL